ncbi:MAG: aminomethyltransferase family protein [Gemmatimonadota bacterium]
MAGLRTTPFHPRTAPLCEAQNWRRWAGYLAAGSYELSHEREYFAIRTSAALLDVSPLYKYHISGPGAAELLDRVVTRDVKACKVGQVLYTPWCDAEGKVIDDGTVTRLDEQLFRMTAADPTSHWLAANARGLDVAVDDVSDSIAALALQGPASRRILEEAGAGTLDLRFFRATTRRIGRAEVTITRTGYTGDLGFEIWMAPDSAVHVWDTLMSAGRDHAITPAGMLALDMARIEAGLILLDVDYVSSRKALIGGQKSTPAELGLDWTVGWNKQHFVGRSALVGERSSAADTAGRSWRLRGVEVEWSSLEALYERHGLAPRLPSQAWRTSVPLYETRSGEQVGYATSGCWSPLLKRYITLSHIRGHHAAPGTELEMEITVEHQRRRARAHVRELPWFDPPRKRA